MKQNVGNWDRVIRIIVGVVLLLAGLYYQTLWGLIGIIPLLTGLIRVCPLYYPMGLNSNKDSTKK
ncbi:MAG: DUF2892 domain-containing protein [Ignavibacteria bacterium]|nr:DUF2892 domain-containing protein [Ignavibacteria bacterium]